MGVEGIGASVVRKEDRRFITGKGRYVDDIKLQGMTYAHFVRSPHAHAKVKSIDSAAAMKMPGVVAVLTGQQIVDDKVGNLICGWAITSKDGTPMKMGAWPAMAPETVRFVGQAVAVVIAETKNQAKRRGRSRGRQLRGTAGRRRISRAAIKPGAPQLHPEAPGNVIYDWTIGDEAATEAAFKAAANVVSLDITNNRLVPNAMEPRAAIADYDEAEEHFTLLHDVAESACRPSGAVGLLQHRAGAQAAGDRARRRRRLRLQDLHLSGRDGGAVGLEEGAAPGEVDRRPLRGVPDRRPWPRSRHQGRDGVRQGQQDHSACGSRPTPISAPICRCSPPRCRPISTRRCCRASTTSRTSSPR